MKENPYKEALEAARRELEELEAKRAEMDARIARLRETVTSLAYLVNDEKSLGIAGMGLTDAVAKVLRLSQVPLTPAQIRDELARMGFDTKKYSDIIPNIVKVLERLHQKGHVDIGKRESFGRSVYIWSSIQPQRPLGVSMADLFRGYTGPKAEPIIDPFVGTGSTPKPQLEAKKKKQPLKRRGEGEKG